MTAARPPDDAAALLAGGRFHEAIALYAQRLRGDPTSVAARIGLGQAHAGAGDLLAAAAWFNDAIRFAPGDAQPLQHLADIELLQRHYAQALPLYRRLLAQPGRCTAANLLHAGFCEENAGTVEAAVAYYREAIAADPRQLEAQVDLAGVLWRLEDFEGALREAGRAVALAPDHPYAQRILGTALLQLNRLDEAERHLRRALDLQPDFALAQLDLAFVLLLQGRLPEGWALYEQRWRDGQLRRPAFFRPESEWQGTGVSLAGKTVAVYGEQGHGDVLQFLRYLPRLEALGAKVVGVFHPQLVPLVEASFPSIQCLQPGRTMEVQLHAALLDLPARLGTTLEAIPAAVPYLRPSPQALQHWAQRLAPWAHKLRVGLAWSGSPQQVNNRNRAVPLSLMLPLARIDALQCFSLQKGEAGAWTDVTAEAGELVDLTHDWQDFDDSAAMIAALDLVITVDTAIAHLAGGLGKPVWIVLAPNADWRWLLARADSPWYPTARLFRRAAGEDRGAQLARVRAALDDWLAARQR